MPFTKQIKNKQYFKRFQPKFRRRREFKTDYAQRQKLINQDQTKYNTPKYRFVVRFTNKDIVCQFVTATIKGDLVHCAAYSHELPKYGVTLGLTNYAAAYCTGLLCARRMLTKLNLADKYEGQVDVDGNDYNVEENMDGPRPFCALLDVGLTRTNTGNRVFSAMKGACDGGVNIPHSEKRFQGHDGKELNADVLRKFIFGGHVSDYMKELKESDPSRYEVQFSRFVKAGIKAEDIEGLYKKAHAAIRADPSYTHTKKPEIKVHKRYHAKKRSLQQRKDRIKQKKTAHLA